MEVKGISFGVLKSLKAFPELMSAELAVNIEEFFKYNFYIFWALQFTFSNIVLSGPYIKLH